MTTEKTLNQLVNLCGNAKARYDKAKDEYEALKRQVIEIMSAQNLENAQTGQHKAVYHMNTTHKFDTKGLAKALPEVYDEYNKTIQTEYFRVF